ncbi:MAG TPA: hypothetical protein VGM75_26340 [Pseudonocardiaceae bacterium]
MSAWQSWGGSANWSRSTNCWIVPFAPYGFILRDIDVYLAALADAGLAVREHRRFDVGHLLVAEADAA